MKHALLSAATALALLPAAQAADTLLPEMTIEASRLDKASSTLTQSASVVEAEEIARGGYTDVTEILRSLAGIEFKQVGGPGQYNYLKMRGFGAGHVLVVVDGVTLNQAGSGDVGNLLSQLDPASISRIEVLRGPQAVLYGANATAGVISITTKRGGAPRLSVGAEAGSLGWQKLKASWQHAVELGPGQLRTSVHASRVDSDGVHKYEGFKDETFQFAADYSTEQIDAGISLWHTDSRFDYAHLTEVTRSARPSYWGGQLPDPNAYNTTRTAVLQAYVEHHLSTTLSHRLAAGQTLSQRKSRDLDDGLLGYITAPWDNFTVNWMDYYNQGDAVPIHDSGSPLTAHNKDRSTQFDYSLRYAADGLKALAGAERYESSTRQWGRWGTLKGEADRGSFYVNGEYAVGDSGLTLAAGLRHDDYDVWGDKTTGSLGASYRLGSLTLFANHGTSYRAPTLQQLFNPNYGSVTLKPESGRTTEIGVRQHLANTGLNWEATLWHAQVSDVVIYDSSIANPNNPYGYGQYANADKQRTRGIEFSLAWALDDAWTVKGNYTYTDSHTRKVGADDERTVQIARHKANLGLFYVKSPFSASAHAYYTDKRLDWTGRDWIDDYVRVDVAARYAVSKDVSLYARVENVFDADAPEGLGYKQPGTYGIVGVEYRFF